MYYLYFFIIIIIYYASVLLTAVHSYVLLAANLDDFRTIAKKFVPENLAHEIEDMVQDNSYKYRESLKDDDQTDRTVEYSDETQQSHQDPSFEVTERQEYKEVPKQQQPVAISNKYRLKSAAAVEPVTPAAPPIAPLVAPPGVSLDDIVEKVKQRLQIELLNRAQAQAEAQAQAQVQAQVQAQAQALNALNVQALSAQASYPQAVIGAPVYKNIPKKKLKLTQADAPVPPPVNVVKEEVQYEATYEETQEKVQGQLVQSQPQLLQNKPIIGGSQTKNILPVKENTFLSPKHAGVVKKVRYVKQVVVPAKPIVRQPSYLQQESLQQPEVVQQQGLAQQQSLVQQPSPMQQQRQQLNRIAQKKVLKSKKLVKVTPQTSLQAPPAVNEGVAANLESIPAPSGGGIFEAVDLQKTNDSYEDYVTPPKDEVFESEEPTLAPVVLTFKYKITPKGPTVPTAADNVEKLAEEVVVQDPTGAVEYEYEAVEATTEPKAKTESISYEEKEVKPDPNATVTDVTVKGKVTKKVKMGTMIPTKEYYRMSSPNYYGNLPTIAEKYNFNEPIPEADREPENLKPFANPPASINGKVMLL